LVGLKSACQAKGVFTVHSFFDVPPARVACASLGFKIGVSQKGGVYVHKLFGMPRAGKAGLRLSWVQIGVLTHTPPHAHPLC
jgi:hypothetical protein